MIAGSIRQQDQDLRIRNWIESIVSVETSSEEPPIKRARQRDTDAGASCTSDIFKLPYNALLPDTPPPTYMSDTDTSRGRKRGSNEEPEDNDVLDVTPKPKTKIPVRHLLSSAKRARSSTPTKSKQKKSRVNLELLEKPVHLKDLDGNVAVLPQDVKTLYSCIQKARHREDIIPSEVRDRVVALVEEDEARQYYFRKEATVAAESMFDALYEITLEAKQAVKHEYHETGWNHFVHTPLLKLVYPSRMRYQNSSDQPLQQPRKRSGARVVNVMAATIWGSYIPIKPKLLDPSFQTPSADDDSGSVASGSLACSVSVDSASDAGTDQAPAIYRDVDMHSRSNSKKVDYVLAMDIEDDTPLQKLLALHLHNDAIERGLIPHVNQTLYPPLQYSPIACSIETKVAVAAQDPMLQLGIWVAAWHKRMYFVRQYLLSRAPPQWHTSQEERLPSVLAVEVVNHEWQLYFACDRGTWIDFYGPLSIGSTKSIIEGYMLIASLEAIKEWIEKTFHPGMERWLKFDKS